MNSCQVGLWSALLPRARAAERKTELGVSLGSRESPKRLCARGGFYDRLCRGRWSISDLKKIHAWPTTIDLFALTSLSPHHFKSNFRYLIMIGENKTLHVNVHLPRSLAALIRINYVEVLYMHSYESLELRKSRRVDPN